MISTLTSYALWTAAALFVLGLVGVLVRRNVIFVLLSIEIMLNAAGLAFVAAACRFGQADGQVMFILILSTAAAEAAVALGLILQLYGRLQTLDTDEMNDLRG